MTISGGVKGAVERVMRLVAGDTGRMMGRSLILAFHNVVPDHVVGAGDRSLHMPFSRFSSLVDAVEAHCDVRRLADLLVEDFSGSRPSVAFTFDDAYHGAVSLALPELSRRRLPSTLFVAPGLLGTQAFWWDVLATDSTGLPQNVRERALNLQGGRQDRILANSTLPHTKCALTKHHACASEDEISALCELGDVELGAHTWSHPNLTRISAREQLAELSLPLEWLRSSPLPTIPVLAYPYGLTSPAVEAAVEEAGYAAALMIRGGWLTDQMRRHPMTIPRYDVPAGLSTDGLLLRLAGTIRA